MPKILVEVPDTVEGILRPVSLDIARTLFGNTQVVKDIQILFPGDIERAQQKGGSIDELSEQNPDSVKFPYTSQMSMEVQEEYVEDRMLTSAIFRPEELFVFRDDAIETGIRPVYSMTQTTINFKYRAKDKTEAIRWRDDIRNRTAANRDVFVHDVKYHYLVPKEMIVILKELHRMREAVAPYGDDWETYWRENVSSRVSWLTNQSGQQGAWGVAESQLRVQGWFDFTGVPEQGNKDNDGSTWTISFAYHFQYEKPIACSMYYPLMIHNQVVAQKYRPGPDEQPPYQIEAQARSYSLTGRQLRHFETGTPLYHLTKRPGHQIPSFDEFLPEQVIPQTLRVFTLMIQLDPANPRALFNLKTDLGDIALNDDMWCCIDKEIPFMTQPGQSVFNLSLYRSTHLMTPNWISIDANYNITATADLDLRQYYHVRFSIARDLRQVNPNALKRLQSCPDCFNEILAAIDPTLPGKGLLPCVVGGTWVPSQCLDQAIDEIDRGTLSQGNHQVYSMNTVETFFIKTASANLPNKRYD
jgi:hypothetical protein